MVERKRFSAFTSGSDGENEDALLVVHEGLRLGEIRRPGACLDGETVEPARSSLAHDAPRAPRHLGNQVGAEPLHDLIERTLDRRKRRQPLDHAVAPLDRLAALDRLAIVIDRPGREVALAIRERLVELGGKAVRQVVEHVFARRDVDLDVAPFLGRDLGEAPLHQRLPG
jgi:hypothetical protein